MRLDPYTSLLVFVLFLTTPVSAQELPPLVSFSNGDIADANDINNNFDNLNRRIVAIEDFGGCSVTQDGSSVVITCADGSSGVLAGEGTVVVYPEGGVLGEVHLNQIPSGDIVLMDANDVVLSKVSATAGGTTQFIVTAGESEISAMIVNSVADQRIILTSWGSTYLYYHSSDCSGQAFASNSILHEIEGILYVPVTSGSRQEILAQSRKKSGYGSYPDYYIGSLGCEAKTEVKNAWLMVEYTPAPEILNAAYPVRLQQLP
ncbi:hypothetical protein IMCC3088_2364 [Aequoribacter fuscus]|uniref:Uncharacterized protein n=1 Tax=Aequoribacter fuscus TaxID=2518989 RepID=F3L3Y3_9GAMM|nr:hypothetical protein [Aequoribacter fuscus]EGG28966.1 hypothetical protein IMCC3088_2364 [Aequoribacter fuscus]QHJ87993.1 hypothetical protein EYZ66_06630 [Aequoribacter fuscus]